jgi:hypothetical protein
MLPAYRPNFVEVACKTKKVEHAFFKLNVKVKSLSFNRAPRHEGVLWEWRNRSTHSLTSALDGGVWSASRPCHFTPSERVSGTHLIGG